MTEPVGLLNCTQCGRDAGDIFGCSERVLGNCPFVLQWQRWKAQTVGVGLLVALVVSLLIVALISRELGWCAPILVPMAIGFGLWGFGREAELCDARLGNRLRRTTWAGRELSHRWITKGRLLPIHLEPRQPLAYPLSTVALAALSSPLLRVDMKQAGAIFRAALIHLLSKQCIEVHLTQTHVFRKWQRSPSLVTRYVLSAVCNPNQASVDGALEKDILRTLAGWPFTSPAKASGTDDPTVYELVLAFDKRDRSSFSSWLVGRVARDAVARGFAS